MKENNIPTVVWLDRHFPGLRRKYQQRYGNAYEIPSDHNQELQNIFYSTCKKHGIVSNVDEIFTYSQQFPVRKEYEQLMLFDYGL